jgi:hypothetical protein
MCFGLEAGVAVLLVVVEAAGAAGVPAAGCKLELILHL